MRKLCHNLTYFYFILKVYHGVPKDCIGECVTSINFLRILNGDAPVSGNYSGKVLRSGPNDNVLIYFNGHGNDKVLQFPKDGDNLHRDDLIEVLSVLKRNHLLFCFKNKINFI